MKKLVARWAWRTTAAAAVLVGALALTPAIGGDTVATAAGVGDCLPDSAWPAQRQADADRVVTLVNQHRASLGLVALKVSPTMTGAAVWKARHMAHYRYMQHDDPAPPIARTWYQRVQACGYTSGAGENIAYGYPTPEAVMSAWLNSSGHRANIESPSYRVIGVGAAGPSTIYWAQNFGTYDDSGTPSPPPPPPPPPSGDTSAPSSPTGLTATAASTSQINLAWSASSDNVAVTGYRIYRNGAQIATTASTSFGNSGLSPSTTYTYTVRAYDAAGNLSGASNSASATTQSSAPAPDTTAPGAPPALTGTATSTSQLSLSWGAATDNVGVTGYRVYRGSIQVATTSATSRTYNDSGLAAGTAYTYSVRAYDAAGNLGGPSSVTVTTQSGSPTPPPPPPSGSTVFPTSVTITSGSLRSGTVSRLAVADGYTFDVYASTAAGRAEWYGSLSASNAAAALSVRYVGSASASCTQTLAIYNWTSASWLTLNTRAATSYRVSVTAAAPSVADYVSGSSGAGEVRVRVACTRADSALFWTRADLLSITTS